MRARAAVVCALALLAAVAYAQPGGGPLGAIGQFAVPLNNNGEPIINPNPGQKLADPPLNPYVNRTAVCPSAHGTVVSVQVRIDIGVVSEFGSPFSWDALVFKKTMNFPADYPPFAAPILKKCRDGVCMKAYEIDMYGGMADLGCPAGLTPVITYNGTYPGPTFLLPVGEPVMVRFNNRLNETGIHDIPAREPCEHGDELERGRPTTIHVHGGTTVAPYDGWAGDRYCPGFSKDYVYASEIVQFAWYHDHSVDYTTDTVYYGLAGLFIVDFGSCAAPWNLDKLPQHIWAVGDKSFWANCSMRFDEEETSLYGDVNWINGAAWPVITMDPVWTRIRFLGASNERFWLVRFVDVYGNDVSSKVCKVYASESGISRVPLNYPATGLHFVPGERWEIVCNFEGLNGKTLYVWNEYDPTRMLYEPLYCYSHLIGKVVFNAQTPANPAKFVFNGIYETNIDGVISNAVMDQALRMAAARNCTRTFHWNLILKPGPFQFSFGINDETWFSVQNGAGDIGQNTWEVWCMEVANQIAHPLHLHMTHGYILERGGTIDELEPYEVFMPKDVWQMYPGTNLTVLVRFGPHQGEWAFHCHNTKHEDKYMMRSMTIVPAVKGISTAVGRNKGFEQIAGDSIYAELADYNSRPATTFGETPSLSDALDAKLAEKAYRVFYPDNQAPAAFKNSRTNPWIFHCNKLTTVTRQNAAARARNAVLPYDDVARQCGWGIKKQCKGTLPALGTVPGPYKYPA